MLGGKLNIAIKQKPLVNYQRLISTLIFFQDTDAHTSNIGAIESEYAYHAAKVDHGVAFDENCNDIGDLLLIEIFFAKQFEQCSLTLIGYQELKEGIERKAQTPYDVLECIIDQKFEVVKAYILEIANHFDPKKENYELLNNWINFNLSEKKEKILTIIKLRLATFQTLAFQMNFDLAIFHKDEIMINEILKDKMNFIKPIFAFHKIYQDNDGCVSLSWPDEEYESAQELAEEYGHFELASQLRLKRYQPS